MRHDSNDEETPYFRVVLAWCHEKQQLSMGKAVRVIEIVWTAGALLTKMLLSLAQWFGGLGAENRGELAISIGKLKNK